MKERSEMQQESHFGFQVSAISVIPSDKVSVILFGLKHEPLSWSCYLRRFSKLFKVLK